MNRKLQRMGLRFGWMCGALLGSLLVSGPLTGFAQQKEARTVLLSVNEIKEETVPFAVKSYRAADPNIAKVEMLGDQKLRISGGKIGSTDLQVVGDGDATVLIKVVVRPDIQAVLDAVRKDLDNLPEVEADVSLGKVVLRGKITKPAHWKYLQKIVLPGYGDQVQCKVSFEVVAELLIQLKSDLEKAGFKVAEGNTAADNKPGSLSLSASGNNLYIGGSVYTRREQELIASVISSQHWLETKKPGETKADADKDCYAIINVEVVPTMLELDVAFVGVTDVESDQIGGNIAKAGLMFVQAAANVGANYVRGSGTTPVGGASYLVGTDMNGTMKFFAGSGPGRFKSLGHLAFKNEATEWKTFQSGGTLNVPVVGNIGGSLQTIEYGLILKAKGGLMDANSAALDIDLTLSTPIPAGNGVYDVKKNQVNSSVLCPVGKTFIMAGTKELFEGISNEGVPILRKIPLLSFFFSEKNSKLENRKLLIMISPQIARAPERAAPAVEQTLPALQEVEKPLTNLKSQTP